MKSLNYTSSILLLVVFSLFMQVTYQLIVHSEIIALELSSCDDIETEENETSDKEGADSDKYVDDRNTFKYRYFTSHSSDIPNSELVSFLFHRIIVPPPEFYS